MTARKSFKYRNIAVGGTFDHVHRGHRLLLKRAFETGEKVVIGVTSDDFVASLRKKINHDFVTRKRQLELYLQRTYPGRDYTITKLEKRFGPGMFNAEMEAIVVSSETAPSVSEANATRRKAGVQDLKIEVVPLVLAEDKNKISSTRIRAGEIDTEGKILRNQRRAAKQQEERSKKDERSYN